MGKGRSIPRVARFCVSITADYVRERSEGWTFPKRTIPLFCGEIHSPASRLAFGRR